MNDNPHIKVAENKEKAWDMQETYEGRPHGWVQLKNTDLCMDLTCSCGHLSHIDGDFILYVKCPACGKVFMVNGHVELIELKEEPDSCIAVGSDN